MTRVLITCRQMQNVFEVFRPHFDASGIACDLPPVVQQLSEETLADIISGYDGMIAGDDPITAEVLAHAARLRVISKWGVGTDGIDLAAARDRGVLVTNTPGVFGDSVADVAAAYLVMLARQLHRIHDSVAAGGWLKHEGVELAGKALGVVGYGSVGAAVALRGRGFGMAVAACDTDSRALEQATEDGVRVRDLDEIFESSDFVVLCTPLTSDSRHMVNRKRLGLMKHESFLVNVARGGLVDPDALVDSLGTGRLAGAALDVFADEPLDAGHPLHQFPQCVFGSHNASNTRESVLRASEAAVRNLLEGLGVPA